VADVIKEMASIINERCRATRDFPATLKLRRVNELPMPIFQCYFFSDNRIDYVENVECDTVATLRSVLERLLSDGEWDAVQAWNHDRLICEVGKLSESPS